MQGKSNKGLEKSDLTAPLRMLVLSVAAPLPANNGVKMRTLSVMRALAADGHSITLLTFVSDEEEEYRLALQRLCKSVITVPHNLKSMSLSRDYLRRLKYLTSELPFGVETVRSRQMAWQIDNLLNEGAVDVVLSEQTDLLVNVPRSMSVPLIVDFHNTEYVILDRYIRCERNPIKRLYARNESRKLKMWETDSCRRAAVAIACSEHDRELLQAMGRDTPVFVVPNVIDPSEYRQTGVEENHTILFQGGMDWYPNRDAVEFFTAEILPLIRLDAPDAKFVIAGRNPPKDFEKRLTMTPGVEFTGTVADMRAYIAKAAICVVPLRIGSGTRLKILESAAMGKPVVSTPVGAEGLDFIDGQEILLRDRPVDFARAVAKLLRDPAGRHGIGSSARARVEQSYSFPCLQRCLRPAVAALKNICRPIPEVGCTDTAFIRNG